jgi:hypothetical protein
MISNHSHQLARKFARPPTQRQVVKAMISLGNKDGDSGTIGGGSQPGIHVQ